MNHYKHVMLAAILALIAALDLAGQCNGYAELCNKRYNEVSYLTTHNSFNAGEQNFLMPNQNYGLTRQLNDGVRGFMLDVHNLLGTAVVYHGVPVLGTATFSSVLDEIKTFLDANPNEVVTIILESYVSAATIESSMNDAGLMPYSYAKDSANPWPTLQEMINSGKRLVLFSDVDDGAAGQEWYHYMWDHAVENQFSVSDTASFDCSFNRGDPANDLFIFNHFITDALTGTGSEAQSAIANSNPFLLNRVQHCMQLNGKFPNFVTVDFYEVGDVLSVVNTLNGVNSGIEEGDGSKAISVLPNPADDEIIVQLTQGMFQHAVVEIYDLTGQLIFKSVPASGTGTERINVSGIPEGFYVCNVWNNGILLGEEKIVILK